MAAAVDVRPPPRSGSRTGAVHRVWITGRPERTDSTVVGVLAGIEYGLLMAVSPSAPHHLAWVATARPALASVAAVESVRYEQETGKVKIRNVEHNADENNGREACCDAGSLPEA